MSVETFAYILISFAFLAMRGETIITSSISMEFNSGQPSSTGWAIFPFIWYACLFLGFFLFLCIGSCKNGRLSVAKFICPCCPKSSRMFWSATPPTLAGHVVHVLFGSSKKKMKGIDAQLIITGMTDEHLRRDRTSRGLPHKSMGIPRCRTIPHIAIAACGSALPDPAITDLFCSGDKFFVKEFIFRAA